MWQLYHSMTRKITHFDLQDFLILVVVCVVVGVICLRGYGSRSNY